MANPLDELIAASLDMIEQVGGYIDIDDRVEDPKEHDLHDALVNLQKAVAAFDKPVRSQLAEFIEPYCVVCMPLNEDGNGPEIDPSRVAKNVWEVWDSMFATVATFDSQEEAESDAARRNSEFAESK